MEALWSEVLKEEHKKFKAWKHTTEEEKSVFVRKVGNYLFGLFVSIVKCDQTWPKGCVYHGFTLILWGTEVQTEQGWTPQSNCVL